MPPVTLRLSEPGDESWYHVMNQTLGLIGTSSLSPLSSWFFPGPHVAFTCFFSLVFSSLLLSVVISVLLLLKILFIYWIERERERKRARMGQRGTEGQGQVGSAPKHRDRCGLDPTTWDGDQSRNQDSHGGGKKKSHMVNQLSHSGTPIISVCLKNLDCHFVKDPSV